MRIRIRTRAADERGAVLVMVAVLMVVILGSAALAIDATSWTQTQSQAQNAADAAALAAAHDLPSSPGTATTDAQNYVNQNLPGATTSVTTPYNSSTSQVKVTVTTTGQTTLGGLFGVKNPTVSASSVAAETGGSTICATPGTGCDAIFAMDSSCSGTGVVFGGGTTITGGVDSNGALNVGGGGSNYGPTTYGSGCTVKPSGYATQSNTFTSGPTGQPPTCSTCWPINYATDFPSCTGAACTGPGGTPSFCTSASTAASWSLVSYSPYTLTSHNIYCGVGSGTASTPTTWNGTISASQSGSSPIESTYVARSVTIGGGSDLTACGYSSSGYTVSGCSGAVPTPTTPNYPLIYVVGTGSSAIDAGSGGTFLGDMFAPNGTIKFDGGGNTTTFLEGYDVNYAGGGDIGDGPSDTGTGGSSSGSASLVG
jgi:Flp pilus assembly protein TadG